MLSKERKEGGRITIKVKLNSSHNHISNHQEVNMDTTLLFSDVPKNFVGVFEVVFGILREHWRTIGKIALFQFVSIVATMIVLFLVTFAFTETYIVAIKDHINRTMGGGSVGGFGRALFDTSVGMSGATRFLEDYGTYNAPDSQFDPNIIYIMLVLYVLWVVGFSLVNSVFVGTYYHALANIYGGIPSTNISRSLKHGLEKMCVVFKYHVLYIAIISAILFFFVGIPILFAMPNILNNVGWIFLGLLLGIIPWVIFAAAMAGATPSIIVEKKSATQAIVRSWNLCQSFLGFVICTRFMFNLFVMIVGMIVNSIFDQMPGVLAFLGHIFVSSASAAIEPM